MDYRIEYEAEPAEADLQVIVDGLLDPAETGAAASAYVPFAFFARDAEGGVAGGVVGNTGGPWLYVSALWVTERLRGHRIGSSLMDRAEQLGIQRGCTGAYLDTFSARALAFYEARGYETFGRLDGFDDGGVRSFLRKTLRPEPAFSSSVHG